jgi:aspartate beta-hydroxylase
VADQTRDIQAGVPFVFDDSFEHEAWHDGTETRITLIVDIWHPDLIDREVRFLSGLQKSKMR